MVTHPDLECSALTTHWQSTFLRCFFLQISRLAVQVFPWTTYRHGIGVMLSYACTQEAANTSQSLRIYGVTSHLLHLCAAAPIQPVLGSPAPF